MVHKEETLCWSCVNACGRCSWSSKCHTPVEGWSAEKTTLKYGDVFIDSFRVISCPMYDAFYKKVTIEEFLKFINWSKSYKTFTRCDDAELKRLAKQYGYKIYIDRCSGKRFLYLLKE